MKVNYATISIRRYRTIENDAKLMLYSQNRKKKLKEIKRNKT